ncbi:hypothetical protein [Edaphocola aurantiacus]|uniref:hypothetical protein n=1 Tax=Edaphocola aurantiacus TaxID=2601682 RepID=UPI001C94445E|nr:hypothetical protein [Edaphocola aurantiacus]
MKVNFDIINNYTLSIEGKHLDLQNNFNFVGFEYNIRDRVVKLLWEKTIADWVNPNEYSDIVLIHKGVNFLRVIEQDDQSNYEDDSCLGEISFFPSALRAVNDSIIPQSKPNDGDDILYFFENGQLIRIHCTQIVLEINPPL